MVVPRGTVKELQQVYIGVYCPSKQPWSWAHGRMVGERIHTFHGQVLSVM